MKNYLCRPQKKDRTTKLLSLALLVGSAIVFYLSTYFSGIKAILQLISVIMLLIFVQITTKFLLTEYRYGLEEENLYLSSRTGKREKNLGYLSITKDTILLDEKAWQEKQKEYKITHRFSYCQNLFAKNKYYLLSPEENGFVLLVFEPDEILVSLLKERMLP